MPARCRPLLGSCLAVAVLSTPVCSRVCSSLARDAAGRFPAPLPPNRAVAAALERRGGGAEGGSPGPSSWVRGGSTETAVMGADEGEEDEDEGGVRRGTCQQEQQQQQQQQEQQQQRQQEQEQEEEGVGEEGSCDVGLFDALYQGQIYLQEHDFAMQQQWAQENEVSAAPLAGGLPLSPLSSKQLDDMLRVLPTLGIGLALAPLLAAYVSRAFAVFWRYFLAGGLCCMLSHGAAVPFDVVKTSIQLGRYSSMGEAFVRLVQERGPGCLFAGLAPTAVGYTIQGFLKFGFYEAFKPGMRAWLVGAGLPLAVFASVVLSSALADAIGSTALTPMETVRIRMVSDSRFAPSLRQGLMRLVREGDRGVLSLFDGLGLVLLKQVPYTITKLSMFEVLSKAVRGALPASASAAAKFGLTMACALGAGFMSTIASQPGDTLMARRATTAAGATAAEREGADVAAAAVAHGSQPCSGTEAKAGRGRSGTAARVAGLFTGLRARLVHVSLLVMMQLVLYDLFKTLLGIDKA